MLHFIYIKTKQHILVRLLHIIMHLRIIWSRIRAALTQNSFHLPV